MVRYSSIILALALLVGACADDAAGGGDAAPTLVPSAGLPQGGYLVEIGGAGLIGAETVTFGDLPATVVESSPGLVVVMAPVAEVGDAEPRTVDVVITSGSDVLLLEGAFTFTPEVAPLLPQVVAVEPDSAPNDGGVEVSITGEGFGEDPRVFFGTAGLVEAEVVAVSPTRIEALVPAAPEADRDGLVTVAVRDGATGHEGRLFGAFQYGAAAAFVTGIDVSPTTSGAMVVEGVGFAPPLQVTFAGVDAEVVGIDPTAITVLLPSPEITGCESITGQVVVEMGGAALTAPDPFTFGASPAFVTGYETHEVEIYAEGIVVADTPLVVEGTGFVGETIIRIGVVELEATPDERPPAESFAIAVLPAGAELGGTPGDTLSGVLVNGHGCEVQLPGLLRLVRR